MVYPAKQATHSDEDIHLFSPHLSLWVNASAGTGKTKLLTDRVLSLLLQGIDPASILCLTFTKAAAEEMLQRIFQQLHTFIDCDEVLLSKHLTPLIPGAVTPAHLQRARHLFFQLLDMREALKIETLHAFSQRLLRCYPEILGLPHSFSVIEDWQQEVLFRESEARLIEEVKEKDSVLSQAFYGLTQYVHESQIYELMYDMLNFDEAWVTPYTYQNIPQFTAPQTNLWVKQLQQGSKTDQEKAEKLNHFYNDQDRNFPLYVAVFLTQEKQEGRYQIRKNLITKSLQKLYPDLLSQLEKEALRLIDYLEARDKYRLSKITHDHYILTLRLQEIYTTLKQQANLCDYHDLIRGALKILQDPQKGAWALYQLDSKIDHVFLDEAQDTSKEQWQCFQLLTAEFFSGIGVYDLDHPRSIFVVGDFKQSIYSFQGAEPAAFLAYQQYFEAQCLHSGRPFLLLNKNTSYRSTKEILAFVDIIFQNTPAKEGVNIKDMYHPHQVMRAHASGAVKLWPLIKPELTKPVNSWKPPVEQNLTPTPQDILSREIAAEIIKLLYHEPLWLPSRNRYAKPQDIFILFRQRTSFMSSLAHILKSHHLPISGIDRMRLNSNIAVNDILSLCRFVLVPEDDYNLAVLLKSAFFNISDEALLPLCATRTHGLWHHLQMCEMYQDITDILRHLIHYGQNHHALTFLDYIYDQPIFRGVTGLETLLHNLGVEHYEAIIALRELALHYHQRHQVSLSAFYHEARLLSYEIKKEGQFHEKEHISLLTIHAAKGLQAPIIILPDTTSTPQLRSKLLFADDKDHTYYWVPKRDWHIAETYQAAQRMKTALQHEYHRLLYVALTRAEDYLLIGGFQTQEHLSEQAWYELLQVRPFMQNTINGAEER